jgi:hypothetical protein
MIPYMHPEFVEALLSLAAERPANDASPVVSPKPPARKRKNRFTSLRRLRFLIMAIVAKLILLLIYVCL